LGTEEVLTMDYSVFRAALRAAAKVAITTSVVSCGGNVAAITAPRNDAGGSDVPDAARSVDPVSLADTRSSCNPPAAASLLPEALHADAGVSEEVFACCASELGTLLDAAAPPNVEAEAAAGDPEAVNCCAAVVFRLDTDYRSIGANTLTGDEALVGSVRWTCCAFADHPEGPTCTPWGPPMPPAMPDEILAPFEQEVA
jgi:hypothetical protein